MLYQVPIDCFEEQWVIFRGKDKRPGCVQNTCAHRACPLDLGSVNEGRITCPYHGKNSEQFYYSVRFLVLIVRIPTSKRWRQSNIAFSVDNIQGGSIRLMENVRKCHQRRCSFYVDLTYFLSAYCMHLFAASEYLVIHFTAIYCTRMRFSCR